MLFFIDHAILQFRINLILISFTFFRFNLIHSLFIFNNTRRAFCRIKNAISPDVLRHNREIENACTRITRDPEKRSFRQCWPIIDFVFWMFVTDQPTSNTHIHMFAYVYVRACVCIQMCTTLKGDKAESALNTLERSVLGMYLIYSDTYKCH